MAKVLVAMSGGVDSSLSAYLLLQKGNEVIGATMNLTGSDTESIKSAKSVADFLGIPHYVLSFKDIFQKKVLQPFIEGYIRGRTPNPCVLCNRHIKFGILWDKAKELNCEFIATGHYARIGKDSLGRSVLMKGKGKKEQSYFLYRINPNLLNHIIFPLGDWDKEEVRIKAEEIGLPVAKRKESQDLCFIKGGNYRQWLKEIIPEAFLKGPVIDTKGNLLGWHQGIANFTIGQREGLGLSLGKRYYVKEIQAEKNTLVVGTEDEIMAEAIMANDLNWLTDPPENGEELKAKIRYASPEKKARVYLEGDFLKVEFIEPVRAPAIGQSVVLYRDQILVGGGVICRVYWTK
ncbi:tRNA 2-thiouridine(34) synthase MnmA [bacterium]|nr:tRNA 2-thiouridine(34) synthase MnmA [bacterium]